MIAITASDDNPLAQIATSTIAYGRHREAGADGLAPTTTTAVMLAIGDAIAVAASEARGFSPDDFGQHHPGGSLGRKLTPVTESMRPLQRCRVCDTSASVRTAIARGNVSGRCGVVLITDPDGRLAGVFTDSDLVRLLQSSAGLDLDQPIANVMTVDPIRIGDDRRTPDAVAKLSRHQISELPVVDVSGRPVGLIDVTDLVAAGAMNEPPPKLRAIFPDAATSGAAATAGLIASDGGAA